MMILGYRAKYDGAFGAITPIQSGGYKIISLAKTDEPLSIPLKLAMLMIEARKTGAEFLVIDPQGREDDVATWVDVREAA